MCAVAHIQIFFLLDGFDSHKIRIVRIFSEREIPLSGMNRGKEKESFGEEEMVGEAEGNVFVLLFCYFSFFWAIRRWG